MFQAAKLQEISQVSEGDFMDWLIFSSFPYFYPLFICLVSFNKQVPKTDDYYPLPPAL